eukprot:TRINITY_DN2028_c0_g1_i3.p1 TRINITY_DN2028_c0_g1~~TRINITY_DN2028_c0_g1_i3.p1  ORF type:complete len:304 (+),score=70.97 TRINITY_DN2028_c0_g1_i3:148-1059(+)
MKPSVATLKRKASSAASLAAAAASASSSLSEGNTKQVEVKVGGTFERFGWKKSSLVSDAKVGSRAGDFLRPRSSNGVTGQTAFALSTTEQPKLQSSGNNKWAKEKPSSSSSLLSATAPLLRCGTEFRYVQGCKWSSFQSPIGRITLVASSEGLHCLFLESPKDIQEQTQALEGVEEDDSDPFLLKVKAQLEEYFEGRRTSFDVKLSFLQGTTFQQAVWRSLDAIGYGSTVSYGQQAASLGLSSGSARAVGAANGKNPLPIILPCHRVIGQSGSLTGFGGGLEKKRFLLALEAEHAQQQPGVWQ